MKSTLYLCLLLLGLQVQGQLQEQEICHSPEEQSRAGAENLPSNSIAPSTADFTFKFYKQVGEEVGNKNFVFSPLGISTAFAMLSLGARANTLRELHKGFAFNLTEQEIHEGFQRLLQLVNDPRQDVQLNMSNAVFTDNRAKLSRRFSEGVKNYYHSEALSSNFEDISEGIKEINEYVKTKTHGKIVDLVKKLDQKTVMVLINSIFFEGSWDNPFNNLDTRDDDFFLDAKNSIEVKIMHHKQDLNVHRDKRLSCWIIELPYKGNVTSLFVVPDEEMMKQVENALQKETVSDWLRALVQRQVYLDLPKFSVSSFYDVKSLLEKMGVTEVFSDEADLSGVSDTVLLKVSEAIHKTKVDVRESGTESSATTAPETKPLLASLLRPPPVQITVNKPFMMMVIDKTTSSLLFLAKIVNPAAEED